MPVSKDWTTPGPYLRGLKPSLWHHLFFSLWEMMAIARAARAARHELRVLRRLREATDELPDYLRRDIGLPPHIG
ncbi:MAG TPA: hypothetical protein VG936_02030 [Lacunisphaera sp.]|nr:hypothetical protein [Lacunisphaera sp.]